MKMSAMLKYKKAEELLKKYKGYSLNVGSGNYNFPADINTDKDTDDLNGKLQYADNTFDTITAFQVIEHLDNPWNAIREIRRILKPKGHFIFSIPNTWNLQNRLLFLFKGEMDRYRNDNGHQVIFTNKTLKDFIKGFKLVEKGYLHKTFPLNKIPKLRTFIKTGMLQSQVVYFVIQK